MMKNLKKIVSSVLVMALMLTQFSGLAVYAADTSSMDLNQDPAIVETVESTNETDAEKGTPALNADLNEGDAPGVLPDSGDTAVEDEENKDLAPAPDANSDSANSEEDAPAAAPGQTADKDLDSGSNDSEPADSEPEAPADDSNSDSQPGSEPTTGEVIPEEKVPFGNGEDLDEKEEDADNGEIGETTSLDGALDTLLMLRAPAMMAAAQSEDEGEEADLMALDAAPAAAPVTTGVAVTDYNQLGGVRVQFEAGSENKIIIEANDSGRTYGEAYAPAGITMHVYGLSGDEQSKFKYEEVFANAGGGLIPMSINVTEDAGATQNERTPAGTYSLRVSCSATAVSFAGRSFTVSSNGTGRINVARRAITVVAKDVEKVYGQSDPSFEWIVKEGQLVNGDTLYANGSGQMLYRAHNGEETEQVGAYVIESNLVNSNYDIKFEKTGKLTISRAKLIVDGGFKDALGDFQQVVTREYGNKDLPAFYRVTGLQRDDRLEDLEAETGSAISVAFTAKSTSTPGDYYVVPSGFGGQTKNYDVVYNNGTLHVTKRALTITVDDFSKVYGDEDPEEFTHKIVAPNAALPQQPTQAWDGAALVGLNGGVTRVAGENAGEYDYISSYSVEANPYYDITFQFNPFVIKQAPLTITAEDKTRQYGEANPDFTVVFDGLKRGETPESNSLTGTLQFSCDADTTSHVGDYAITPFGFGADGNYNITWVPGNLAVTPRVVKVTIDNHSTIYGEPLDEFTYTLSSPLGDALVNGDVLNGGIESDPAPIKHVGDYRLFSTLNHGDYDLSDVVEGNYEITKRPITATIDNQSTVYGEALAELTYNLTCDLGEGHQALMPGDSLNGGIYSDPAPIKNVGEYALKSTLSHDDYEISVIEGKYVVTKRPVIVTIDNKTSIYGEPLEEFTYKLSSELGQALMDGDELAGGIVSVPTPIKHVGEYELLSTLSNDNYDIEVVTGKYVVTPRPITLTIDNKTSVYGEKLEEFTYKLSCELGDALMEGDVLEGRIMSAPPVIKDVGEYMLLSTFKNSDYNITVVPGTYTVTPRPIIVTLNDKTSVYGEPLAELTADFTSELGDVFINGDKFVGEFGFEDGVEVRNVGEYKIICKVDADAMKNYSVEFVPGTYTITPRPITITVNDKSSVYGEPLTELTADFTSELGDALVYGDEFKGHYGFAEGVEVRNVGEYEILCFVDEGEMGNYEITIVPGTYTMTKRPITLTIDDKTSVYGEKLEEFTYELSCELGDALMEGDKLEGKIFSDPETIKNVGEYELLSDFANDNYDITVVPGTYTVTKRPITGTIDDKTSVYGDEFAELTVQFSCELGDALMEGDKFDGHLGFDPEVEVRNVGEYAIMGFIGEDEMKNYDVTFVDGTYTITPATITVRFADMTKLYGTKTSAPELIYEGWKYDDEELFLSSKTQAFSGAMVFALRTRAAAEILPNVDVVIADEVAGIKGYVVDNATEPAVYEKAFAYEGGTFGNYTFEMASGNLNVTRLAAADNMFTTTGTVKTTDVYSSNVTFRPAEGYKVSMSDALEGNTWLDEINVTGDGRHDVKFFLLRVEDGAITNSKTMSFTIDTYVPPVVVPNPATGNDFFNAGTMFGMLTVLLSALLLVLDILMVKKNKKAKAAAAKANASVTEDAIEVGYMEVEEKPEDKNK